MQALRGATMVRAAGKTNKQTPYRGRHGKLPERDVSGLEEYRRGAPI